MMRKRTVATDANEEAPASEAPAKRSTPRDGGTQAMLTENLKKCRVVNDVLKADAKRLGLGLKSSLARLEQARGEDQAQFSYWAQLEFREFVRREIEKGKTVAASDMIATGAQLLNLSTETTKRYLRKLRSRSGPFIGLGDIVALNPRYISPELNDYWLDGDDDAD